MGGTQQYPLSFYKNPYDADKFKSYFEEVNLNPKFKKLNNLISEFVTDYGLVSFDILDVSNHRHLNKISMLVDKANGYLYNNSGLQKEEKFSDIRNLIAQGEAEYGDDDDYDEEYEDVKDKEDKEDKEVK